MGKSNKLETISVKVSTFDALKSIRKSDSDYGFQGTTITRRIENKKHKKPKYKDSYQD